MTMTRAARKMSALGIFALVLLLIMTSLDAQICSDYGSCVDCATQGCAWAVGTCTDQCPQDVACIFDNDTPEEGCAIIEAERLDNEECRTVESCDECTSKALPSDGNKTCKWFDGSYCGATCTIFDGCEEMACTSCADIDSCVDCALQSCAWAVGTCSDQCPQDVACIFNTDTPEELCALVEEERLDNEECRAIESCDECTSTALPSDVNKTCKWFDGSYCGATCINFDGCKETACSSCRDFDSCNECATQGCAWAIDSCSSQCPADVSCIFDTDTPEEGCAALEAARLDNEECGKKDSCDICTATALPSDGNMTCKWFDDSYCGATCNNFDGCKETTCSSCSQVSTCVDCAAQGCAWDRSCSIECPADASCDFPTDTPEEDCAQYEEQQLDNSECTTKKNCGECSATALPSDESNTCKWFSGCGGTCNYCAAVCDGLRGCEVADCTIGSSAATSAAPHTGDKRIALHFSALVAAAMLSWNLLWN